MSCREQPTRKHTGVHQTHWITTYVMEEKQSKTQKKKKKRVAKHQDANLPFGKKSGAWCPKAAGKPQQGDESLQAVKGRSSAGSRCSSWLPHGHFSMSKTMKKGVLGRQWVCACAVLVAKRPWLKRIRKSMEAKMELCFLKWSALQDPALWLTACTKVATEVQEAL